MPSVDICTLTYQRPELLTDTLTSLCGQLVRDIQIRVVVIDNDRYETARTVVEAFKNKVSFEVVYDVEPCKNISMARNRAIGHVKAEYFAFIDDDEVAPPHWLTTMLDTLERYSADVVFAPVQGILPIDSPQWARNYFLRPRFSTGTLMKFGGTGNVLIKKTALGYPNQTFDPDFGLSGGEDTDYFFRLSQKGAHMVWCDEALVTEQVPPNRITIKWVKTRCFRSAQSYARIFVLKKSFAGKIVWVLVKLVQLIYELSLMILSRFVKNTIYRGWQFRLMKTLGQLSILLGKSDYVKYGE